MNECYTAIFPSTKRYADTDQQGDPASYSKEPPNLENMWKLKIMKAQ